MSHFDGLWDLALIIADVHLVGFTLGVKVPTVAFSGDMALMMWLLGENLREESKGAHGCGGVAHGRHPSVEEGKDLGGYSQPWKI